MNARRRLWRCVTAVSYTHLDVYKRQRLYEAKIYLETVDLFAWTAIVILLSMGIEALLVRALRGVPQKGGRSVG